MQIMEWDDYNSVRLKSLQTNFPGYLFYDRGFPIGNVYIYPICSSSNETITLTSWKPFTVVNDPTEPPIIAGPRKRKAPVRWVDDPKVCGPGGSG